MNIMIEDKGQRSESKITRQGQRSKSQCQTFFSNVWPYYLAFLAFYQERIVQGQGYKGQGQMSLVKVTW